MDTTYKQKIKEKSREIIWNHAVSSLTDCRYKALILNENYLKKLRRHIYAKTGYLINERIFNDYLSFSHSIYGKKRPCDLNVAFFCGPEPENDIRILQRLGVRLERMYAFEYDNKCFKTAVASIEKEYPQVKIFNGKIETFTESHNTTFDIIYLDFTSSLFEAFQTIGKVLDNNALSQLGVLIVNTTYSDLTDSNLDFLTKYFYYDVFFENCVISGEENEDTVAPSLTRSEGVWVEGLEDMDKFSEIVKSNFEYAYSAFQTDYINMYANITKPYYAVLSNSILKKRLIQDLTPQMATILETTHENLDFQYAMSGDYLDTFRYSQFIYNELQSWEHFYFKRHNGIKYSRIDAMKIIEVIIRSAYLPDKFSDLPNQMGTNVNQTMQTILSPVLQEAILKIDNKISKMPIGLFCDTPMIHLWIEMIVNSLGYPYHCNVKNHIRHRYTAKTRPMCVDVFTLDQCRSFYDWLPMIEYQANFLEDIDRQLIVRLSLDAIGKQSLGIINKQYFGSALIGINEKKWALNSDFPNRLRL